MDLNSGQVYRLKTGREVAIVMIMDENRPIKWGLLTTPQKFDEFRLPTAIFMSNKKGRTCFSHSSLDTKLKGAVLLQKELRIVKFTERQKKIRRGFVKITEIPKEKK